MANSTIDLKLYTVGKGGRNFVVEVAAATTIYNAVMVSQLTADGGLVPGSTALSGPCVGVSAHYQDNSAGAKGDLSAEILTDQMFSMVNDSGTPVTKASPLGTALFMVDDHTVSTDDNSGARSKAGYFGGMEPDGRVRVLIYPDLIGDAGVIFGLVGDMVAEAIGSAASAGTSPYVSRADHRHAMPAAAAASDLTDAASAEGAAATFARSDHLHEVTTRVRRATLAIAVADLVDVATSQVLSFAAALPANARILASDVELGTPFTGGGAATCTVDLGDAGDPDALLDGTDVLSAAVDGQAADHVLGIAPNKSYVGAATLTVTVTSDVNVSTLTAGALTVAVLYTVIA